MNIIETGRQDPMKRDKEEKGKQKNRRERRKRRKKTCKTIQVRGFSKNENER